MARRKCIKCGRNLHLTSRYYNLYNEGPDGFSEECKDCQLKLANLHREQFLDSTLPCPKGGKTHLSAEERKRRNEYSRKYRERNRDKLRTYSREYLRKRREEEKAENGL